MFKYINKIIIVCIIVTSIHAISLISLKNLYISFRGLSKINKSFFLLGVYQIINRTRKYKDFYADFINYKNNMRSIFKEKRLKEVEKKFEWVDVDNKEKIFDSIKYIARNAIPDPLYYLLNRYNFINKKLYTENIISSFLYNN